MSITALISSDPITRRDARDQWAQETAYSGWSSQLGPRGQEALREEFGAVLAARLAGFEMPEMADGEGAEVDALQALVYGPSMQDLLLSGLDLVLRMNIDQESES